MTTTELNKKAIERAKNDFHFYIQELGLESAKKIMIGQTAFIEVIEYVNGYHE